MKTPNRRDVIAAAAALAGTYFQTKAAAAQSGSTAVVFLSRSSNTRMLAGHLSRAYGADLIELRPAAPWPEDYEEMVAWARQWRERQDLMPLAALPDFAAYDRIYLGTPVWGGALPAPMRSALRQSDLRGKVILPFITHGGYGAGSALREIESAAVGADIGDPFILECDQERANLTALGQWMAE